LAPEDFKFGYQKYLHGTDSTSTKQREVSSGNKQLVFTVIMELSGVNFLQFSADLFWIIIDPLFSDSAVNELRRGFLLY
jgi:hypothetical protein